MTAAAAKPGLAGGSAVDSEGRPTPDPTKNVLDLVEAAISRQDDLRKMESQWRDKVDRIRAEYDEKLRDAESKRIDAIRAVDVGAVIRAAEVQSAQASTLAASVATVAETLRTQVAAAATASTVSLGAALDPIQKDIADLRRAQYEAQGQKTQVVETRSAAEDMKPMVEAIQALTVAQNQAQGQKEQVVETRAGGASRGMWIGVAIAAAAVVSTMMLGAAAIVVTILVSSPHP